MSEKGEKIIVKRELTEIAKQKKFATYIEAGYNANERNVIVLRFGNIDNEPKGEVDGMKVVESHIVINETIVLPVQTAKDLVKMLSKMIYDAKVEVTQNDIQVI